MHVPDALNYNDLRIYGRHAKNIWNTNIFFVYSTASLEESRGKNDERCGRFVR